MPRKYNILTSDNLSSRKFLVTNKEKLSESCQLLRDIDFSVLANEEDIIKFRLFNGKLELIAFDYIANKNDSPQIFTNDKVNLEISFSYQPYSKKSKTYMLYNPSFTIIKHPDTWSNDYHYGQCGQSCPCCRSHFDEILGACPICNKINNSPKEKQHFNSY